MVWTVEFMDEFDAEFDALPESGVWRVAFAFDPRRRAVFLVGADKSGVSKKRFYTRLVKVADERYDVHLTRVKSQRKR
jgi:hypothetical protein